MSNNTFLINELRKQKCFLLADSLLHGIVIIQDNEYIYIDYDTGEITFLGSNTLEANQWLIDSIY